MLQQLDLWSTPEASQELKLGDVFEIQERWADGDTSPIALERLAKVLLGDLELSPYGQRPRWWARVITTRIEGKDVIATCKLIPCPLGNTARDEEDDEMD